MPISDKIYGIRHIACKECQSKDELYREIIQKTPSCIVKQNVPRNVHLSILTSREAELPVNSDNYSLFKEYLIWCGGRELNPHVR